MSSAPSVFSKGIIIKAAIFTHLNYAVLLVIHRLVGLPESEAEGIALLLLSTIGMCKSQQRTRMYFLHLYNIDNDPSQNKLVRAIFTQ